MKRFYVLLSGDAYAMPVYDVKSLKEARAEVRLALGVKRLPNGTRIWSNNETV